MNKLYKIFVILFAIVIIFFIYSHIWQESNKNNLSKSSASAKLKYPKKKIILGWTPFFNGPMFIYDHLWSCKELNCELTSDRKLLKDSSALIFHITDINWKDIPPTPRISDQYYVMMSHENPLYTAHANIDQGGPGFFNMSLTYRQDSDLYFPYSAFRRRDVIVPTNNGYLDKIIKNKTKLVAWMSSNCNTYSKRESYVAELRKYIKVDVYGACGNLKCPRNKSQECDAMLEKDYKFYLAFENSNCVDYVTEKFLTRVNQHIVPIVLWKRNYINYAPKMSYISVEDYKSPKDLADYLTYLDKNPQEYKKYLTWRSDYETGACTNGQLCGFCKLCQMVQSEPVVQKIRWHIGDWWFNKTGCDNSLVPKLLRE